MAFVRLVEIEHEHLYGCWKLYFHEVPNAHRSVKWELRRVFDSLFQKECSCAHEWRDVKRYLGNVLNSFDLTVDDAVVTSHRAASRQGPVPLESLATHQIETRALLALLLHFAVRGHKTAMRQRASTLLRSWLHACYGEFSSAEAMFPAELPLPLRRPCRLCVRQSGLPLQNGYCSHMSACIAQGYSKDDADEVACAILQSLIQLREACTAAIHFLQQAASALEQHLHRHADTLGHDDLLAEGTRVRGKGKRALDPDRKMAMVEKTLHDKKAKTVGAMARALGEAAASHSSETLSQYTGGYHWSVLQAFQGKTVLGICFDASRMGMPKEETLTLAVTDPFTLQAAWLAPQAFSGNTNPIEQGKTESRAFQILSKVDSLQQPKKNRDPRVSAQGCVPQNREPRVSKKMQTETLTPKGISL